MKSMKEGTKSRAAIVTIMLLATSAVWAQGGPTWGRGNGNSAAASPMLNALPLQDLSQDEEAGLVLMREEEKLARDVYLYLYDRWQTRIFANIAGGEQRHFDAVGLLLERYGIADPAAANDEGMFANADLQRLYGELTAQGEVSLVEALRVGATIEEIDIRDLQNALILNDNADIQTVYGNLLQGSYSHLTAFVSHLEVLGIAYDAQFLDPALLDQILVSQNESLPGRGRRNGSMSGRMTGGICPLGSAVIMQNGSVRR